MISTASGSVSAHVWRPSYSTDSWSEQLLVLYKVIYGNCAFLTCRIAAAGAKAGLVGYAASGRMLAEIVAWRLTGQANSKSRPQRPLRKAA